ncbi:MAG: hypothetical protein IJP94_01610 [Clostridia bacterium]|nr:hypothetical protein [Clostridia bacterium]MBQ3462092.1 hypothetical protein [Clostridia bacterium]MBQ3471084.1 hypothetical protein [Clostridia bacterium]MBQ9599418.1 hypothetical protein [Clostridia bacterium]MBR0088515.1 hypothetical protein [Clostridia bacterium]
MAEYVANAIQTVADGQNVLLETSIPCNRGYVIHRNGAGILTLRGIVNNPCSCFARYQVTYNGNIAIPTGGTVEEISVALAINGEPIQTSRARQTPAAVEQYSNVTSPAIIDVPRGCCVTVAVENTSGQAIDVQNSNLTVSRIA